MNVRIINPEVLTNLYKNHGEFAHVCYDTSSSFAEKIGKTCADQGHMSGSRCEYIKFEIAGLDRGTSEQCLRHEIGTDVPVNQLDNYSFSDFSEQVIDVSPDQIVKNMASFRYIDKEGFQYAIPRTIRNCQRAMEEYQSLMAQINTSRSVIKEALLEDGVNTREAVQAANFVLPRATTTTFVIGFTPEALIHFCHKRLCNRSQEFIRDVAARMRGEVMKYNPQFAKELVPHCQYLLWCPEKGASCGMYPTRDELKNKINQNLEV